MRRVVVTETRLKLERKARWKLKRAGNVRVRDVLESETRWNLKGQACGGS